MLALTRQLNSQAKKLLTQDVFGQQLERKEREIFDCLVLTAGSKNTIWLGEGLLLLGLLISLGWSFTTGDGWWWLVSCGLFLLSWAWGYYCYLAGRAWRQLYQSWQDLQEKKWQQQDNPWWSLLQQAGMVLLQVLQHQLLGKTQND